MDFVVPKTPWELPAYRNAVAREGFLWEAAFLDLTETVAGFELRPMRVRDYLALRAMKHPLLRGALPTPEQLVGFLWLLSPQFSATDAKAREGFVLRCARFLPPKAPSIHLPWLMKRWRLRLLERLAETSQVIGAVRLYIEETLTDWPAHKAQGQDTDYYGQGCAICAEFAREYHLSFKDTLELPMKCALQFLKEIKLRTDGCAAVGNLSDQVKADFIRKYQEFVQTQRTATHAGGKP